ncbi:Binding-protein-dependent transport systems inner membrane component [Sulfitobacter noctilucicola]|uniref:Glycerol transport system permease protein n=1 Tax=Sulfitobacter noctilucicola TaxID=1342301 RepID=A0A7W6M6Q7_9RHOB|nr:carbohydrate ABC transporter permease [Sulfitobacter noctilucicola]KIN61991.1 Binding-protein-dependent transport systems inner membrane component [Sulfitobacter noctilucicola]MBB4173488.1 glycerol transport system permease protein [Sulfitobacter noctilucicola]
MMLRRALKTFALLAFLIWSILPLTQMALLSFISTLPQPGIEVGSLTLSNYAGILGNPALASAFANSIAYVLINICITLPVAIPAAYAFSRMSFAGDRQLFFAFIALRITPPVVLTLPIFQLFSALGIVNSVFGIALAHCLFTLPVSIWILQSFVSAVPRELDETAFLDGYSRPRFIWTFLLPQIAPGIAVTAFFCFMFSWVEVVFARILTTTNGKPISMAISALFGFQTDIGLVMAVTTASMIPGALLLFAMRNHLSRGFRIGRL